MTKYCDFIVVMVIAIKVFYGSYMKYFDYYFTNFLVVAFKLYDQKYQDWIFKFL